MEREQMAVDRDAVVGFRAIRLDFDLDTDADEEELSTLLKLTERYCVVFQTLSTQPELSVRRVEAAGIEPACVAVARRLLQV